MNFFRISFKVVLKFFKHLPFIYLLADFPKGDSHIQ